MWVRGHSRLLKMVPIESLGTVSYSYSIVTMAVSLAILQTFDVKEWPDLEIWVWGPSRSLKIVPFDRACMTFYRSAIVLYLLPCFSYLTLNNIVTLKSGLEVTQDSKLVTFASFSILLFALTMALYTVSFVRYSELLVQHHKIFIPHLYLASSPDSTPP